MKFTFSIIVLGICVGLYFLYISPTLAEVSALREKKAEYIDVLNKSKELKAKRDTILASYNNIPAEDIARLSKIVPEKFDAVRFANDINSIANRSGVSITDFTVNTDDGQNRDNVIVQPKSESYKTSIVNMTVTGGFEQFIRFLTNIESSLELMDVRNLVISSSQGERGGVTVTQYLIEMNTYSLQ